MDRMHLEYVVVFLALGVTGLVALTLSWDAFWREVERRARESRSTLNDPDQTT